jgi:hypothetical protein
MWKREKCTDIGVALLPEKEESEQARITNVTLSIPRLGRDFVGLLSITKYRLVFFTLKPTKALTCHISAFHETEFQDFPDDPSHRVCWCTSTESGECFSIQGEADSIEQLKDAFNKLPTELGQTYVPKPKRKASGP